MAKPTKSNPYGIEVGQTLYYVVISQVRNEKGHWEDSYIIKDTVIISVGKKYASSSTFSQIDLKDLWIHASSFDRVMENKGFATKEDAETGINWAKNIADLRKFGFSNEWARLPRTTIFEIHELLKPYIKE